MENLENIKKKEELTESLFILHRIKSYQRSLKNRSLKNRSLKNISLNKIALYRLTEYYNTLKKPIIKYLYFISYIKRKNKFN